MLEGSASYLRRHLSLRTSPFILERRKVGMDMVTSDGLCAFGVLENHKAAAFFLFV